MEHERPNFKQPWKREDFVNHENCFAQVIRKTRRFHLAKNILGGDQKALWSKLQNLNPPLAVIKSFTF